MSASAVIGLAISMFIAGFAVHGFIRSVMDGGRYGFRNVFRRYK